MVFMKSIVFICAALVVSLAMAEETVVPDKRFFFFCYNHFVCPSNSYRLPFRWCYDSFDDCACNHGYYKSGSNCMPYHPDPTSPPCDNHYVCPANSFRLPNQVCYDSFDDCECEHGFYKSTHEERCIRITPAPVVPPTRPPVNPPVRAPVRAPRVAPVRAPVRPPTPVRNCNYSCPVNSYRIPNRKCYSGFSDCECNSGYYKSSNGDSTCIANHY